MEDNERKDCMCGDNNMVMGEKHVDRNDCELEQMLMKIKELNFAVIELGLTPNRGDLLSMLGMAYEVAAIYGKEVKPLDLTHGEEGEDLNNSFEVRVNTENCSLFLARKALNVTIKESPDFIKNRLIACGIRPINNVVDISNYVMIECGQPLHFYDADRLGNVIETRMATQGEKLTTLDEIEREFLEEMGKAETVAKYIDEYLKGKNPSSRYQ